MLLDQICQFLWHDRQTTSSDVRHSDKPHFVILHFPEILNHEHHFVDAMNMFVAEFLLVCEGIVPRNRSSVCAFWEGSLGGFDVEAGPL